MLFGGQCHAVTMWDFSWLERRWAGAGFEDWDQALSQLVERGYDMVRIDAYPHLVAADGDRMWTLAPHWNQQIWGAQSVVNVRVLPALLDFLRAAAAHGVAVGLSTWFRKDVDNTRAQLTSPGAIADVWIQTLRHIETAGLIDVIAYVDLCNEFPLPPWASFLYGVDSGEGLARTDARVEAWMTESIAQVRATFPDLAYTYSFAGTYEEGSRPQVDAFDLLEPHIWMASSSDYYRRVGYQFERFESVGYDNLALRGRDVYFADKERFDAAVFAEIDRVADWSRASGKPVVTTECWSVIDYKDWPGLDWDWVKELNERAVIRAAATGRWVGIATSNFCAPQFVEMWRDVEYHRRLTEVIRNSPVDLDLVGAP